MDFDLLSDLREFDFSEYFGVTISNLKLDNSKWNRKEIIHNLKKGIRGIRCSNCGEKAFKINFTDKTVYCSQHVNRYPKLEDEIIKIKRIVKDFKDRILKIEKLLALIQERSHFLEAENLITLKGQKDTEILDGYNKILDRKIDAFIKSIKSLKKNKGFEMYIEVKDTYDEVNVAVSDILKFIHSLLYEPTSESFYSVVTEELELSPNNDRSDDEANESRYIILPPNAMYDKPVGYFAISYFSAKKVNQLQDQIHRLCKWGEGYFNTLREKEQVGFISELKLLTNFEFKLKIS